MTVYTYTTFDDPLAFAGTTFAFGINDLGQIVGYYDNNSGHHGFLLSGGTYTTLDDPSADAGNTWHMHSAIGQVAGQYTDASGTHVSSYSGVTRSWTIPRPPLPPPLQTASMSRGRSA